MNITLTPKAIQLCHRMNLENPCEVGSDEWNLWQSGAMMAILFETKPGDNDVPAVHEGYEWGCKFNEEWNES